MSKSPDLLPPVEIEPARSALDHTGRRFSDPAPRTHEKPSHAFRDACMAVVLSLGPAFGLMFICWVVLRYGDAARHLLGLQ